MYKIEDATLQDFMNLANKATETGLPDYQALKDMRLSRLIIDGELYSVIGVKEIEDADGVPCNAIACIIRFDVSDRSKTFVRAAREYLDSISDKPIVAMAQDCNLKFRRFLEFMGFKFNGQYENWEEIGVLYRIYIRGADNV